MHFLDPFGQKAVTSSRKISRFYCFCKKRELTVALDSDVAIYGHAFYPSTVVTPDFYSGGS